MAGRKPDYRLVVVEENKGRKTSFKLGAAWKNEGDNGVSIGIEVNVGVPIVLQPHSKLVLFENREEEETDFPPAT
jgi:hypothetical protein